MASLNRATLIGNLGADPEMRVTQGGQSVCKLSVATNERWKDKDGNQQERTEWHNVVAWGNLADNCGKYLVKGKSVFVEGRIQTRKYDDKDGVTRYATEIVANDVIFLSSGSSADAPRPAAAAGAPSRPAAKPAAPAAKSAAPRATKAVVDNSFTEDDIPF